VEAAFVAPAVADDSDMASVRQDLPNTVGHARRVCGDAARRPAGRWSTVTLSDAVCKPPIRPVNGNMQVRICFPEESCGTLGTDRRLTSGCKVVTPCLPEPVVAVELITLGMRAVAADVSRMLPGRIRLASIARGPPCRPIRPLPMSPKSISLGSIVGTARCGRSSICTCCHPGEFAWAPLRFDVMADDDVGLF
jgi:hypothetical protein